MLELTHQYDDTKNFRCEGDFWSHVMLQDANLWQQQGYQQDFSNANMTGADCRDTIFSATKFTGANLTLVNFSEANLMYCDFTGATMDRTDLTECKLHGCTMSVTDLKGAICGDGNLLDAEEDFNSILELVPNEVAAVLQILHAGQIDGNTYEGECCDLIGTIAKMRMCSVNDLPFDVDPGRPIEQVFMLINAGDTPYNHPIARIVSDWIIDYLALKGMGTV